jgi:hypothetical protein
MGLKGMCLEKMGGKKRFARVGRRPEEDYREAVSLNALMMTFPAARTWTVNS